MSPQQLRLQALYLFLALGCALLLTVGCDEPPHQSEIDTVNGQVETDYPDSMLDNGTPLRSTQMPGEETWASPDNEPDSDVKVEDAENPPVKPQYDLNAGTGSDENAEQNAVMELRDESLSAGQSE